ncbi:MAG TPA: 2-dehydro-3-deoxy-6-phosphogalactonate aldolase [Kiloniellales bacterium]
MSDKLLKQIAEMPLIAILRGIMPDDAAAVSDALVDNGFTFVEVTLNSPGWEKSLKIIHERHGKNIVLGAGTVLTLDEVNKVQAAGGKVIISPNMRVDVIRRTKELNMLSVPGCYSPTECFAALDAGADILKIFPADTLGPSFIKAVSAVLPEGTRICPTGGITEDNMKHFMAAGVYAMGIGSALYKPGKSAATIAKAAAGLVSAYKKLR